MEQTSRDRSGPAAARPAVEWRFRMTDDGQMKRRMVLAGLGGALGAFALSRPALALTQAFDVRLGNHGAFTRVVLDLSEQVRFSLFTLADPYRVVVDLPEVDWQFREQGVFGGGGLVAALRYGLFQPGNSRIVFDLNVPAGVRQAFVLPPGGDAGWRFVLDLERVSHGQFVQAAGPAHRIGSLDWKAEEVAYVAPPDPTAPRPVHRKPVIVLDPGHGGVDPGAIGVSGVYEKNITLAAGREFKKILEKTGRYTVHLTRDRDVFLKLRDRIRIGRGHDADLFISLHADAMKKSTVRGLSVYTLSEKSSDAEAAALAEAENKADIIAGIDLSGESPEVTNILIDLAQRESMNLSSRMAETMIEELRREVTLLRRTHRYAGFAVLKAPDVPSILIEMGYLSNPDEERLLRTSTYRGKLAEALTRSVDAYFAQVQKASRP
jgi:N-acetylmuramoyl-L-alanine amidase